MSEDWKNFIFIALGKVNLFLLTELQEESYQGLRCSDTSINPLLKLFIPFYLSAQLFVILSIKLSTNQGRCPDTAANVHTYIHIFNPHISVQFRHKISSYPTSISDNSCVTNVPNAIHVHSLILVVMWSKHISQLLHCWNCVLECS
jgi:hypothetical protein